MVFEGKPLHEPVVKAAETVAPKETPKPAAAPKPAKKHGFRNFLLTTLTIGSLVYVGGAWYALEDETVHDFYADYVPFGDAIVATLERRRFKDRQETISRIVGSSPSTSAATTAAHKGELVKTTAHASGGLQSVPVTGNIAVPVPAKDVAIPVVTTTTAAAPVTASATSATAPATTTTVSLPLVRIPNDIDPLVANSIHSLNNLISSVNESKHSHAHIERLARELDALTASIDDVKRRYQEELGDHVKSEAEKAARLVEARTSELRTAVAAQEEKLGREYRQEQQRLANVYNERLQREMGATNGVLLAEANNKLLAAHVERQSQFAETVEARLETERAQRAEKLGALAQELKEIEALTNEAEQVILESDKAAQLHLAVARLKSVLAVNNDIGVPPAALGPYVKAIEAASGSDPLLAAALASFPASALEDGVLTPSQLLARFHILAPSIRQASLLPPDAGVLGHFGSLVFSKLLWAKSGNPTGTDIESVLSRAETALSEGRVTDAVGEVNSLKGWPKRLAKDWLEEGRKRSEVEFLVGVVAEEGKLWEV